MTETPTEQHKLFKGPETKAKADGFGREMIWQLPIHRFFFFYCATSCLSNVLLLIPMLELTLSANAVYFASWLLT